uniref:Uncharacterized protein n=1 Tax=Molossus molossus TaxID=27622 RepID=A0A7J8ERN9_MOLMO|nr:hypothetical protein HJG59_008756 [Molossus molossus]
MAPVFLSISPSLRLPAPSLWGLPSVSPNPWQQKEVAPHLSPPSAPETGPQMRLDARSLASRALHSPSAALGPWGRVLVQQDGSLTLQAGRHPLRAPTAALRGEILCESRLQLPGPRAQEGVLAPLEPSDQGLSTSAPHLPPFAGSAPPPPRSDVCPSREASGSGGLRFWSVRTLPHSAVPCWAAQ